MLFAFWGTNLIKSFLPLGIPRLDEAGIDVSVLGFTLGLAFVLGIVVGAVPAWQLSRQNLSLVLREEGRSGSAGAGAPGSPPGSVPGGRS